MTIFDSIILGLIQGLTEFLPVSSSGHLTLGKALLGITENGILFEVVVHLGTLFAVLTAFWPDVKWLFNGALTFLHLGKSKNTSRSDSDRAMRYISYLVWGTLPAVAVGLFLKDRIEQAFANPLLAAYLLLATGGILLLSRLGLKAAGQVTLRRSILIGLAQAMAILPGISRSGSTISAGMLLGVEREAAARFSFLLAIPAIAGAFVLQLKDIMASPPSQGFLVVLVVGFIVSYLSGLFAIKFLMAVVRRGRFDYFAWYCFAIGLLGIYFLQIR